VAKTSKSRPVFRDIYVFHSTLGAIFEFRSIGLKFLSISQQQGSLFTESVVIKIFAGQNRIGDPKRIHRFKWNKR